MSLIFSKQTVRFAVFLSFIFLAVGLLYYQGVNGPFLLDDIQNLSDATLTHFSLAEWIRVSLANSSGPFGRPLSIASFALNAYWLGPEPFGYKLVNIGLHLLIGFLIYQFIQRLLSLFNVPISLARSSAVITTLLWLVHPLQVSTVLYAVQRMAQLSTLFLVLGMLFYVSNRPKLSFLCWPLALFSKETGVLLPFYLLSLEYFISLHGKRDPKKWAFLSKWSALTGFMGVMYYALHYEKYATAFHNKGYTLIQQLFTQIEILVFYLKLIIFPQLHNLALFHDDFPIVSGLTPTLGLSMLIIIGLLSLMVSVRQKQPILAWGISFFFISHLIESTVLPLELVFEHRNYLALLGPLTIISYYIAFYQKTLIMGPVVALLAFLTFTRIQAWSDSELFLTLELIEHPHSPRAHIEWANFLLDNHKIQTAHHHLSIAHSLAPHDAGIRLHQLLIQCQTPGICQRIAPHELAYKNVKKDVRNLTITPYSILVFNNLVQKAFNGTCFSLSSGQILELLNLAIINPRVQSQKQYLSTLYHLRAGIDVLHHDIPSALEDLEKAYQLYPKRLEPLVEKVHLQMRLNQYKMAEQSLNRVIQLANTRWVKDRALLKQLKIDIDKS